ncbi:ArsR family transcriptional regulator [Halobellus sp. EA9]|uniref:ArsR/SmtB family transcription factor n=1 Tax=Halobellus sp. EA9 TaxID=3421647 RepID=UPI003EC1285B
MDDEQDKLNRFQEAFQRGQEGQISNYEAWLQEHGIDSDKAETEYLEQYFREHPEKAVNHEEQLEEVAEYIGFFSRRSNVYHLPVIGVTGIGKTQFLQTVSDLLKQIEPEIEQRSYEADNFSERTGEEERIFEIRDELRDLDKVVIYVDDCEWENAETLVESLQVITSVVDDALLITSWTPEYWRHQVEEVEAVLPSSTEIHLSPFSEKETVEAVKQVFDVLSDDGFELPEAFLKQIHEYSSGIPGVFTRLALKSMREAFVNELELGSVDSVETAAEKLNLVGLEESVYELSDTKLTILTHMLLCSHRGGIRPSQLVDLIDRDKSTVSYHLKDLKTEGLVESEKQGRSAYYQVKDPVKPFIQLRIGQNGEYNG